MIAAKETIRKVLQQTGLLEPLRAARGRSEKPAPAPEPIPTSGQGQCWFRHTEDVRTRVYVYNYWNENYKIPEPTLSYSLWDSAGKLLGRGEHTLSDEETWVVDSAVLAERHALASFDGTLLLEIVNEKVVPWRVVQFNVDYLYQGGSITSVHGQGGLICCEGRYPHAGVHLVPDEAWDASCVLLNHHYFKNDVQYTIAVRNWRGELKTIDRVTVPYRSERRVPLMQGDSEVRRFLDGRSGTVEILANVEPLRVLAVLENRHDHRMIINHSTQEAVTGPQIAPEEREKLGYGPVMSLPLLFTPERQTRFLLSNTYSETGEAAFEAVIFDAAGNACGEPVALRMTPRGSISRTAAELLAEAGVAAEQFWGNVRLEQIPLGAPLASVLDVVLEMVRGESWAGVLAGGGYSNCPEAPFKRTKIFSRTLFSEEYRSELWLVYPVPAHNSVQPSQTTVSLFDASGTQRCTAQVSVPGNGVLVARLDELFPNIREVLAPAGIGQLKVRDLTGQLNGYHLVTHVPTGTMALDHLYGG